MLRYDPDVIEEQAATLRRQAIEVQFVRPTLFLAGSFVLGLFAALLLALLGPSVGWHQALSPQLLLSVPTVVFGLLGFLRG